MTTFRIRPTLAAMILGLGIVTLAATPALAKKKPQYDLFYNYYEGGGRSGVPVGMYPSPLPVPPNVGQTYITYQPFMPHEFLYPHQRTYVRHGNITHVSWQARPLLNCVIPTRWSVP